jgi:exosortase K
VKLKLLVLALVALIAWGLKRHYADARVDDLGWILSPTARLVSAMTGAPFVQAPGEGYVSHERLFLIEKSCAGINFMVAAFLVMAFTCFHRVVSAASGARLLMGSLLTAYLAAVLVNTVRIAIALWLVDRQPLPGMLTAPEVHRLEGIAVYFGGLVLLHELARRFDTGVVTAGGEP